MEFNLVSEQTSIFFLVSFGFLIWTVYLEVKLKMNYTMSRLITHDLKKIQFREHRNQVMIINMIQIGIATTLIICVVKQQCKVWPLGDIFLISLYSLILKTSQCKANTFHSDIIGIMSFSYFLYKLPIESSPMCILEQTSDLIIYGTVLIPIAILILVAYFLFTFLYPVLAFVTFVTVSSVLLRWRAEFTSIMSKLKKSVSVLLLILLSTSVILTLAYNRSLRNTFETCDNLEEKIEMKINHEAENINEA